mmetsp:Transcript_86644/g.158808  ORF Transcript_86644/g.158808 Transcript_86644/m.158808 type:complete len:223 (+) Transcript_86644:155-823(+)
MVCTSAGVHRMHGLSTVTLRHVVEVRLHGVALLVAALGRLLLVTVGLRRRIGRVTRLLFLFIAPSGSSLYRFDANTWQDEEGAAAPTITTTQRDVDKPDPPRPAALVPGHLKVEPLPFPWPHGEAVLRFPVVFTCCGHHIFVVLFTVMLNHLAGNHRPRESTVVDRSLRGQRILHHMVRRIFHQATFLRAVDPIRALQIRVADVLAFQCCVKMTSIVLAVKR